MEMFLKCKTKGSANTTWWINVMHIVRISARDEGGKMEVVDKGGSIFLAEQADVMRFLNRHGADVDYEEPI